MTLGKVLALSVLTGVAEVMDPGSVVPKVHLERQKLRKSLPTLHGAGDTRIHEQGSAP